MKLLKLATILLTVCFMTTGCDTSSDAPADLLNDDVVYSNENHELYTFVNKSLEGSVLTLPKNSSEVGQINEVDSKIIAFQKNEDINTKINSVGFCVISKESGEYIVENSQLEDGDEIKYANFYDLNNDGNKEVIMLIRNKAEITMNVYQIINEEVRLLSKLQPTWIDDYEDYKDMKIQIGYIDDDSKIDVLMINHNKITSNAYANIINYEENNNIKISNSVKIENVKNLDDLYIESGDVYKNKRGTILSIPTANESKYMIQILFREDNKLQKAFDDKNMIVNPYYIPVQDINDDEVLDIPLINNNIVESVSTNSKSSCLITWKKWNNQRKEDSNTLFVSQIYYNYKDNFKLLVPNELADKLYIQNAIVSNIPQYTFYYYYKGNKEPLELFQMSILPKKITEDNKSSTSSESVLIETEGKVYRMTVKDMDILEKYNLTVENMKEYFSVVYE